MLAVKRGYAPTVRAILDFGVTPTVILRKDADRSTPLHVAVQNTNTAIVEILIQYGPTELLYMENSVGQTPLDIASLKNLPRKTGPVQVDRPCEPQANVDHQLRLLKNAAPFDVEKQKVEIPKLRATLDALIADGCLVRGTKLATELFAFLDSMEGKLAIEVARKIAERKDAEGGDEVNLTALKCSTESTYALLRDAAAARSGRRQLVHLADVHQSVKRCLAQEAKKTVVGWSVRRREVKEEADPEEQRIAQSKARSLFGISRISFQSQTPLFGTESRILIQMSLFGEDRF